MDLDDFDAERLSAAVGTPTYVLSPRVFRDRLAVLRAALESRLPGVQCFYSVKANANPWLLREALEEGWGLDVCSVGDLWLAELSGAPPAAITCTGVGIGVDSLPSVRQRVGFLNIDSVEDLRDCCLAEGTRVGLRLAPRAGRTGAEPARPYASRKLGIPCEDVPDAVRVARSKGLIIEGLHCHPGSSVTDVSEIRATLSEAFDAAIEAARSIPGAWDGLRYLNVGGGIGLRYDADAGGIDADEYASTIAAVHCGAVAHVGAELEVHVEPGEWVVSPAGVLLTRVVRVMDRDETAVAIVDASLNQYMGTSFYRPNNAVTVVGAEPGPAIATDVYGCTNSPADRFCLARDLPHVERGDLLVVHCVGGYGYARGGRFNEQPQAPEVLVRGGRYAVVRERETVDVLSVGVPNALEWADV